MKQNHDLPKNAAQLVANTCSNPFVIHINAIIITFKVQALRHLCSMNLCKRQAASSNQSCPFLILSPAVSLSFARRQASLTKLVQVLEFGVTLIHVCTAPETLSWASAAQKGACIHISPRRATSFSIENLIDGDKKWRGCHRRTHCRASRRRNRSRSRTCNCCRRHYRA